MIYFLHLHTTCSFLSLRLMSCTLTNTAAGVTFQRVPMNSPQRPHKASESEGEKLLLLHPPVQFPIVYLRDSSRNSVKDAKKLKNTSQNFTKVGNKVKKNQKLLEITDYIVPKSQHFHVLSTLTGTNVANKELFGSQKALIAQLSLRKSTFPLECRLNC